ncbi:PP2C family protein-serine/threonine phosphatase [Leptospira idonii]|nr:SpoIIE family protein phosphatase [Leptospira idonii]
MGKYFRSRILPLFFIFFSFQCNPEGQIKLIAEKGIVSLSEIDFQENKLFSLNGEWEFYWNESYFGYLSKKDTISPEWISVPGSWTDEDRFPKKGKALYRLRIFSKEITGVCGLKVYEFPGSYRLYLNGKLAHENGKYSETPEQSSRSLTRPYLAFPCEKEMNEIVFEVVNEKDEEPGPRRPLLFGSETSVRSVQEYQQMSDTISFGILVFMGLYHIGLFFQRRMDRGSLLFGIFCLLMSFRILVTEEHYLHRFYPDFPSALEWKLDVLSFLVLPPFLTLIFSSFFQKDFNRKILYPVILVSFFLSSLYLITNIEIIFVIYLILALFCGIYLCYVLYLGVRENRVGAKVFLLGWIVFLGTVVFDLLSYANLIRSIYISHLGFLFFIFSQANFLSVKFNFALATAEELTTRLDQKVRERTDNLNKALDLIRSDLNMAKSIQETSLRRKKFRHPYLHFVERSVPHSEIGGDIFDVREIHPGYVRVFLADATGHGVRAAFITMMIISESETILNSKEPPSLILQKINERYTSKYGELNLFFTSFILDFDFINGQIHYSSAGHPTQYLIREGELVPLKTKGKPIGVLSEENYHSVSSELYPKDRIYIFTDGLYEEIDGNGEAFGQGRLEEFLLQNREFSLGQTLEDLFYRIGEFRSGRPSEDDVTFLGFEVEDFLKNHF